VPVDRTEILNPCCTTNALVSARKSFGKRFEFVRILQALGLSVESKNWITKGLQDVEKSVSAADELP
jgi:hypothetical protein